MADNTPDNSCYRELDALTKSVRGAISSHKAGTAVDGTVSYVVSQLDSEAVSIIFVF
jgi:hypothetical protein